MLRLSLQAGAGAAVEYRFQRDFRIGRDDSCEVQVQSPGISRHHAEVVFKEGRWLLRDLNSANGVYHQGTRIDELAVEDQLTVELGMKDAVLTFAFGANQDQGQTRVQRPPSVTDVVEHYFQGSSATGVGQRTRMIREAFKVIDRRKKRRFALVVLVFLAVTLTIGSYSYLQYRELERQRVIAEEIFYNMKSLELEVARLELAALDSTDLALRQQLQQQASRQGELAQNYQRFLEEIDFYADDKWTPTDRVILRVARVFGECELAMPEAFRRTVYEYIERWRGHNRLQTALARAREKGYARIVAEAMLEHHLPPQFFFLALQESDFREFTIGPKTRFGIAKGMWQFIPATALRYGLQTGPLVELRRYDPRDERFSFEKATRAAARYIRDIYSTEAQASGLLVMASYNWGENRVRNLVRQMPENPRERNFWKFYELHRKQIPRETENYVFNIISASVIAEDPQLFGFDVQNPLLVAQELGDAPAAHSTPAGN